MHAEKLSYHKKAAHYLKQFYENNDADHFYFSFSFLNHAASESRLIAKSLSLKGMDYQNAIVAAWFRYAGVTGLSGERNTNADQLLQVFYEETAYPDEDRLIVSHAMELSPEHQFAGSKVEQVLSDAINSRLAWPNLMGNIILLKEEVNRLSRTDMPELFYLKYIFDLFLKCRYYTAYADENYSSAREKNFQILQKRIQKVETAEKVTEKENQKLKNNSLLSGKETEDLFKIAFRNYNQLISVADSKAALLINVNSIIISVMLAFVVSKVERNMFLLVPTIVMLFFCMLTILLSVLASRPRKNSFSEDRKSHSYQKFFFGSFDLIDPSFRLASWDSYYSQLTDLFHSSKEDVYLEVYKETFNVRKVLSKKFNFLAMAYWVFLLGLTLSIVVFIWSANGHTIQN